MGRVDALKAAMQGDPAAAERTLTTIPGWNGGAHTRPGISLTCHPNRGGCSAPVVM